MISSCLLSNLAKSERIERYLKIQIQLEGKLHLFLQRHFCCPNILCYTNLALWKQICYTNFALLLFASIAYRLWLPFLINRVFNLAKLRSVIYDQSLDRSCFTLWELDRKTDRQKDRKTDRQTNKQTGRQTDRQAGRQAGRQTDRQLSMSYS